MTINIKTWKPTHNTRHKVCFNCKSRFDKDLNIMFKRRPVIIGTVVHHLYCCRRCFEILTKVQKKYKRKDFTILKGDKNGKNKTNRRVMRRDWSHLETTGVPVEVFEKEYPGFEKVRKEE